MSGTVWTKFYWSDWDTDPAVRLCSIAAQGLWMRMLCIAAAHDPIGYVAVAGRGLDETSLARLTGCQESEVTSLLGELERNGVFSRDRHNRIYSRRMTRDARKASIAKKNGKLGGNPTLSKDNENPPSDKASVKSGHKPHKPSANSPTEKPVGFSRASAKKHNGWIEPKTPADAANNIIRRIREHELDRIGDGDESFGKPVLQLPATG